MERMKKFLSAFETFIIDAAALIAFGNFIFFGQRRTGVSIFFSVGTFDIWIFQSWSYIRCYEMDGAYNINTSLQ